ncbi:coxsackievirus and adenovirus receptor homolog [Clinocottus analis]|uniref:coxsackievirus and adenovirus receptor homolog n=1 Tax=Clinocottus analis TaxID=304258 RepID=UPI0035C0E8BE
MASKLFLLFLLFLSSLTSLLCVGMKNISVTVGQNVTLECRVQVSKGDAIGLLEWKKEEMNESERYVYFFRDDHLYDTYQNERFIGRVQLTDPDRKNGDVSVVLRNVTANDSGTYECKVIVEHNKERANQSELVSTVQLIVTVPGMKNISVTVGQNVTLECRVQVSKGDAIELLEWKKEDINESEGYVYFFRDGNRGHQNERFIGRVQLTDPDRKNGDVSVVLRNVTANDSGTYECKVIVEHNKERANQSELVSTVQLIVTEPDI